MRATLLRESIACGIMYGLYDILKIKYKIDDKKNTDMRYWKIFMSGSISGFLMWAAIYPIDIIKTRIQAQSLRKPHKIRIGILENMKELYSEAGVKGFYKGITPCLARSIPAIGMSFVVFEDI